MGDLHTYMLIAGAWAAIVAALAVRRASCAEPRRVGSAMRFQSVREGTRPAAGDRCAESFLSFAEVQESIAVGRASVAATRAQVASCVALREMDASRSGSAGAPVASSQ